MDSGNPPFPTPKTNAQFLIRKNLAETGKPSLMASHKDIAPSNNCKPQTTATGEGHLLWNPISTHPCFWRCRMVRGHPFLWPYLQSIPKMPGNDCWYLSWFWTANNQILRICSQILPNRNERTEKSLYPLLNETTIDDLPKFAFRKICCFQEGSYGHFEKTQQFLLFLATQF